MERFLLVSPIFPPSSEIGAKRALNLARHLPPLGWAPVVLCAPAREGAHQLGQQGLVPSIISVRPEFTSLLGRTLRGRRDTLEEGHDGLPPSHVAASSEPGIVERIRRSELTPLDHFMWDIPFVIERATRIARESEARAILVNADPWSGLIVGRAVARRLGLPWIADMRDPWSLHPRRQLLRPPIVRAIISGLERRLLCSADRIVLNTEQCTAAYRAHYDGVIEPERMVTIRNAFDPALFDATDLSPTLASSSGRFEIHYFGTVGRGRDAADFYEGFARFVRAHGLSPREIGLVFHGDAGPRSEPRTIDLGLAPFVEIRPTSLLRDTVRRLRPASVLLLLEGPERALQLPAKLYDYLAAGRSILAVGANDELAGILTRARAGVSTRCHEGPEAVANALDALYTERGSPYDVDEKVVAEHRADVQASRFRDLLVELTRGV